MVGIVIILIDATHCQRIRVRPLEPKYFMSVNILCLVTGSPIRCSRKVSKTRGRCSNSKTEWSWSCSQAVPGNDIQDLAAIFGGERHAEKFGKQAFDKHQSIYDKCVKKSIEAGQRPGRPRRAPPGPSWPTSQTSPNGQNGMPMINGQPGYGQDYWPSYGRSMYGRYPYGHPPGGQWSPYQFYQPPMFPMPYFYGQWQLVFQ